MSLLDQMLRKAGISNLPDEEVTIKRPSTRTAVEAPRMGPTLADLQIVQTREEQLRQERNYLPSVENALRELERAREAQLTANAAVTDARAKVETAQTSLADASREVACRQAVVAETASSLESALQAEAQCALAGGTYAGPDPEQIKIEIAAARRNVDTLAAVESQAQSDLTKARERLHDAIRAEANELFWLRRAELLYAAAQAVPDLEARLAPLRSALAEAREGANGPLRDSARREERRAQEQILRSLGSLLTPEVQRALGR